ncbi:MAG TPA: DUF4394 domain-containing protein [Pyrinomonadaceae bacterium]|nr:DUF4394 domain-containing protein [Pyrinomonadaceae bacterium]
MRTITPQLRRRAASVAAVIFILLVPAAARALPLVGLTDSNRLVLFDSTEPERVVGAVDVTGLQPNEQLLGIDIRPATGVLYAVGSTSRLYTVNTVTGAATQVGSGPFAPALNVSEGGGFEVGMTFDALQDWIRVVSNGQSLRLDPNSGIVVALDGPLFNTSPGEDAGRVPAVTGLAQEPGFPLPTLYGIDWKSAQLVTVGSRNAQPVSPATGEVFGVGWLFVSFGFRDFSVTLKDEVGFDIVGNGLGYASLTREGAASSALYVIDLKTGEAHEIGSVGTSGGAGVFLRGLAALPEGSNLYALTASDKLLLVNAYMPGAVLRSKTVTGLQTGEHLLALDVRQKDGYLYSVGSTGRLYRIAPDTGAATQAAPAPITPFEGTEFSLARDSFHDRMRLVSDADRSWLFDFFFFGGPSISPTATLHYAPGDPNAGQNPRIVGLAFAVAPEPFVFTSRYYGIDADRDALVYEQDPGLGTLHTVGPLGFDAGNFVGFDNPSASVTGGTAYASLTLPCPGGCASPSTLFRMNLLTGQATPVGGIGGGEVVRDIVTAPVWTIHFSKAAYRVTEDCTSVRLLVIRTGLTANATAVDFTTGSGGTLPAPAADGRSDYNAASGTLHFAAGEAFKPLRILISEDSYPEKEGGHEGEAFNVTLSAPRDLSAVVGVTLESPSTATVLIVDDEDGDSVQGNPIDDTPTFVCQHYHDFLGRDPDDAGLSFWTSNIASCLDDARCTEAKRIDTSAAFFLSIELQETGLFLFRAYQAAYGRTPVPLTFEQFTRDVRLLNEGVVIGQPGALERLEANKNAFVEEFIKRPEFIERYPFIRPNEAANFVDSLDANSGGVLSPSERDALILEYSGGGGRKLILRSVVEDEDFKRLAFTRAFVLMQYFGYLRRDPNAAPDSGFGGYDFWLAKLDSFGGDYRRAEMVKAFLSSDEYRKRFGP